MSAPVVTVQPLVAALAAAVAAKGVAFGDGAKPTVAANRPYVVGFFDAGRVENRSLGSRDGWSTVGVFHAVGLSPEATRIVIAKLRSAILELHLSEVGGRVVQMPEHLAGVPMDRDGDADPTLFIQIDEWRFRTTPA